jgi:hypothetical protein
MAGIQYSTASTDATDAFPLPIQHSRKVGAARRHRCPHRLPPVHRCDAEEEPMSDVAARFVYSPLLSTPFKVVCLFCVLGLVLSAAIVPMIAPEYLAWVLSHIE